MVLVCKIAGHSKSAGAENHWVGASKVGVEKGSGKARVSQLRSLGSVAGLLWWDGVGGGGQLLLKVQEQQPVS